MSEEYCYCGACGERFSSAIGADLHAAGCIYVKVFLPYLTLEYMGGFKSLHHEKSTKVALVKKYRQQIERYVRWVIHHQCSVKRVELHSELCALLYVDYAHFKPFESSDIIETPSFSEALELFLMAYFEEPMISHSAQFNKTECKDRVCFELCPYNAEEQQ